MRDQLRTGGLAAWSIRRPVSVLMLALSVLVLGLFSFERLGVDLLPHIIYPDVRVRITDPGVPARIMEDKITRQLEEQLAITEGVISIQSNTSEGRSAVNLSFAYGADIDVALREASNRLDRAKRFLPDTVEPATIYKRDPSQIPVLELAISSNQRDIVALRDWVDYHFSNWFLNLPGVASTEVGGGLTREIQLIIDQDRLADYGLDFRDLSRIIQSENQELSGGRFNLAQRELSSRTNGRFSSLEDLAQLPLPPASALDLYGSIDTLHLGDVAQVMDTHEDERLRIRLDGAPGIKLSIQKQPDANTIDVVAAVKERIHWLESQKLIPEDIGMDTVSDQSVYVRHALRNASTAVISGALLAMLVVYLFLGNLRRTLIIGSAIPMAIFFTFTLMAFGGLTLNIMTLGGLALGVGMLVDNTIVMLENISRHQHSENPREAAINAAKEVNSAILAATSTNLAAILPFLFIGGLVGLLFNELIFTLSAAILSSLIVALTLVPALAARVRSAETENRLQRGMTIIMGRLQAAYQNLLTRLLRHSWLVALVLLPFLLLSGYGLKDAKQIFLPSMDEGQISISVNADSGTQLDDMDKVVRQLEALFQADENVASVFTSSGGFVFGRSTFESSSHSGINVQLLPLTQRVLGSQAWMTQMQASVKEMKLVGYRVYMRVRGVRGMQMSRGDDDISLRIQGEDLDTLARLGDEAVSLLRGTPGIRNIEHNYEETREELVVEVDRERAALLGVSAEDIGRAVQVALDGRIVSDYLEGDRQYNIRLRLPQNTITTPDQLGNVLVGVNNGQTIRLHEVAGTRLMLSPARIKRDSQRRIVEIGASLNTGVSITQVMDDIDARLSKLELPDGYTLYDGGLRKVLREGQDMFSILLSLALFLVFVVMAVQYESLRNPLIIMLGVPFAIIGVALGLYILDMPISMPVWLGLIMLAGIVVNNAIILVEQIEIQRQQETNLQAAIIQAASLRLRPILMTVLTTVIGMLPLALGFGEGAEMLKPLALVIVFGLSFSTLVSLIIIPNIYHIVNRGT
ncbi:RND efflux system, inner membrane transporter [hydrothermal vent metagenome]|uniref:RND efflux system, inner membrane transporter n=1 Tax=hydrothermal vent metagenome TaxID=652676 RepID=A0A3B1BPD4_9ZZZZ